MKLNSSWQQTIIFCFPVPEQFVQPLFPMPQMSPPFMYAPRRFANIGLLYWTAHFPPLIFISVIVYGLHIRYTEMEKMYAPILPKGLMENCKRQNATSEFGMQIFCVYERTWKIIDSAKVIFVSLYFSTADIRPCLKIQLVLTQILKKRSF